PPRIELARLTVRQYRNAVADLIGSFRTPGRWDEQRGLRGEYFKARRFRDAEVGCLRIIDESGEDYLYAAKTLRARRATGGGPWPITQSSQRGAQCIKALKSKNGRTHAIAMIPWQRPIQLQDAVFKSGFDSNGH